MYYVININYYELDRFRYTFVCRFKILIFIERLDIEHPFMRNSNPEIVSFMQLKNFYSGHIQDFHPKAFLVQSFCTLNKS